MANSERIVREYGEDILKNRPRLIFIQKLPDYLDLPHFTEKYLNNYVSPFTSVEQETGCRLAVRLPIAVAKQMVDLEPPERSRHYAFFSGKMYERLKKDIKELRPKLIFLLADKDQPLLTSSPP